MSKFFANPIVHGALAFLVTAAAQYIAHSSVATLTVGAIAAAIASWVGGSAPVVAARGR